MTLNDKKEAIVLTLNTMNELQTELFQALIINDMPNAFANRVARAKRLLGFAIQYLNKIPEHGE